ncbi:complement C1q tumor necrosis factor-related protein 6 isoform X2 [Rissa tridactyla]|uniref:complement C1q tumor necrosis factor-related protein 6 isoform X2 n=2 Tax=Laridae TaxID=8910 RepID=UPI0023BAA6D4|nr:complement C1q tumor necrosis factor-related protein 6 isoform X2 [Rissa tridactyla]
MGQRGTLPSVSVSEFSCTPENLLTFNSTGSCQHPHQQQAGADNTTDHKNLLLSAACFSGGCLLPRFASFTLPCCGAAPLWSVCRGLALSPALGGHPVGKVSMDIIYLRTPLAFLLLRLVVLGAPTDEPNLTEPDPGACKRCCDPLDPTTDAPPLPPSQHHWPYPVPEVRPYINITILKGEKGDRGEPGMPGKWGKEGPRGERGAQGQKGSKGQMGTAGDPCKHQYAAFSVGRKKALHSSEGFQVLIFDTVFVNLYSHFDMFNGKFYCYVGGLYYFSLNVHTWNFKETYMHIMHNEEEAVILYAQPSDRSIMQSQSLMLELQENDEIWADLTGHCLGDRSWKGRKARISSAV